MCNHRWVATKETSFHKGLLCTKEVRTYECMLCGKIEREVVYVKAPPKKRKLPKFLKDDLSAH